MLSCKTPMSSIKNWFFLGNLKFKMLKILISYIEPLTIQYMACYMACCMVSDRTHQLDRIAFWPAMWLIWARQLVVSNTHCYLRLRGVGPKIWNTFVCVGKSLETVSLSTHRKCLVLIIHGSTVWRNACLCARYVCLCLCPGKNIYMLHLTVLKI